MQGRIIPVLESVVQLQQIISIFEWLACMMNTPEDFWTNSLVSLLNAILLTHKFTVLSSASSACFGFDMGKSMGIECAKWVWFHIPALPSGIPLWWWKSKHCSTCFPRVQTRRGCAGWPGRHLCALPWPGLLKKVVSKGVWTWKSAFHPQGAVSSIFSLSSSPSTFVSALLSRTRVFKVLDGGDKGRTWHQNHEVEDTDFFYISIIIAV